MFIYFSYEKLKIKSESFTPADLAKELGFKKALILARNMFLNEARDDSLQEYATELLEEIRKIHSEEGSADWKNDVFLGDACYMTMKYNERYEAYKRAYEKATPPPPSLLIALAGCYLLPKPPITLNEAENLAKTALEKEMSIEGVILLRGIYSEKNDQTKFDYWDTILKEVEKNNVHTQNVWPDFSDIHKNGYSM
jgi:hypothetical protein